MPSRVAAWSDRLIEASWLMVALVVPLFFDVFSSRVFEPDKLTAFRGIMLVALSAWLIRELEIPGAPGSLPERWYQGIRANPFGIPIVVLFLSYAISTIFSVQPEVSIFGSYQRLQGTLNNFLYFSLFLLISTGLRSWGRVDRLVTAMILTSVPVGLYGWIQHFARDPLPWGGDVTAKVAGSMGNSIFLGAYLILIVPFILARILTHGRTLVTESASRRSVREWLLAAGYLAALIIVLVCIFWTDSRGPWLGLTGGLIAFGLYWTIAAHNRALLAAVALIAVVVIGFLVTLNATNSPLAELRESNKFFNRLGTIADLDSGTNKVRMLIWFGDGVGKGAAGMITAEPFRTVVGWGPETMYVAYNRFYPPDLAHLESRSATPDRSHNDLLDFLVTNGAIGLFAYLLAVVSFIGLMFRVVLTTVPGKERFITLAVFAGAVSHWIESLVGIPIAATRTHFWMIMGIGAALPALIALTHTVEQSTEAPETAKTEVDADSAQKKRRTRREGGRSARAAATSFASRPAMTSSGRSPFVRQLLIVGPTLLWLMISAYSVFRLLLQPDFVQRLDVETFPTQIVLGAFGWVTIGIVAFSLALPLASSTRRLTSNSGTWLGAGLTVAIAVVAAVQFANPIIADIHFKRAQSFDGANRYDLSIPTYLRSIQASPNEDFYYLFLGRAYLESAKRAPERGPSQDVRTVRDLQALRTPTTMSRETLYQASLVALEEAFKLNPKNTDHSANLGRLYRFWADVSTDPNLRRSRLELSDTNYARALDLSPNAAHLWTEWAQTKEAQGQPDQAQQRYDQAIRLDRLYAPTYLQLGNFYLQRANQKIAENDRDGAMPLFEQSASNFREAVRIDPNNAGAHSALGFIYSQQGRLQDALAENEIVAKIAPNDLPTRRNLALIYRDLGMNEKALQEARFALNIAPADQKPQLQLLVNELEVRVQAGAAPPTPPSG